ncbi:MAG: YdcF family protein [bacterium]
MDGAGSGSSSRSSGNKPPRKWRKRLLALGALLILVYCYQAYRTVEYSRHIPDPPQAEIAIVLGARSEGSLPLPVFRERIECALRLYSEGKVQKLLFTGAPGNPPQAIVARDYATARGVPEAAILIETRSWKTIENLRFAKELLPDPSRTTVLIVSDPLHLRRAMKMAEDLDLRAFPAPTSSSAVSGGWGQLKMTLREAAAYLKYWVQRRF